MVIGHRPGFWIQIRFFKFLWIRIRFQYPDLVRSHKSVQKSAKKNLKLRLRTRKNWNMKQFLIESRHKIEKKKFMTNETGSGSGLSWEFGSGSGQYQTGSETLPVDTRCPIILALEVWIYPSLFFDGRTDRVICGGRFAPKNQMHARCHKPVFVPTGIAWITWITWITLLLKSIHPGPLQPHRPDI